MTQAAAAPAREALAAHGAETIAKGSKSFAMASLLFGRDMQADVQMLYAWCRYCDDVIDGQDLGQDAPDADLSADEQARRLDVLKADTHRAMRGEFVGHPAFDGFSIVARKHKMPERYAMDLLDGFAMDVARAPFVAMNDTMQYCYGVAGAVGIMMAIVMGVDPEDEATLDRACDLGLAFQLTNICRDVIDDARGGRIYLPAELLAAHHLKPETASILSPVNRVAVFNAASHLLDCADQYYNSASQGVRMLPPRAAAAVAAARNVYRDIGRLVRERGPDAWVDRPYTSTARKAWLAAGGVLTGAPQSFVLKASGAAPRGDLWRRPL
ncbi:MAG: phytoene/squalene synthase family protein [Pseudomonadota bacterium]